MSDNTFHMELILWEISCCRRSTSSQFLCLIGGAAGLVRLCTCIRSYSRQQQQHYDTHTTLAPPRGKFLQALPLDTLSPVFMINAQVEVLGSCVESWVPEEDRSPSQYIQASNCGLLLHPGKTIKNFTEPFDRHRLRHRSWRSHPAKCNVTDQIELIPSQVQGNKRKIASNQG